MHWCHFINIRPLPLLGGGGGGENEEIGDTAWVIGEAEKQVALDPYGSLLKLIGKSF